MSMLENIHVDTIEPLATPREIHAALPQTARHCASGTS